MRKRIGSKISRNKSCPCGSGLKYKNCCLPRGVFETFMDQPDVQQRSDDIVGAGHTERIAAMHVVPRTVLDRCRNQKDWQPKDANEKVGKWHARRIQLIFSEIQEFVADLFQARAHSRQYWYQLSRHTAAFLLEELSTATGAEANAKFHFALTKSSARLILVCAQKSDPWEWVEVNGTRGIDFRGLSRDDLLVLAKVYSLAALHFDAEGRYRLACKGYGVFGDANDVDTFFSQTIESVTGYEARRARYETFAGSAGLWYDKIEATPIRKDLCLWAEMRTVLEPGFMIRSLDPLKELELHFVVLSSFAGGKFFAEELGDDFQPLALPYDYLLEHEDLRLYFETAFGVESLQLVAFIYLVYRLITHFLRFPRWAFPNTGGIELVWQGEPMEFREKVLHHWSDVGTFGFLRSHRADWVRWLHADSTLLHRVDGSIPELDVHLLGRLIDQFTWRTGMPFYSNQPILFTELSSRTLLLDGFSLGDFLRHILLAANLVSKEGSGPLSGKDVTGPWLERQAAGFFARELGLDPEAMLLNKKVKKVREIDIAFVFDRTLFVIDCKAMAKDADYMVGEHSKIRNRHYKMREELLNNNDQRIRLIDKGLAGDVISKDDYDCAHGLVCTSAVEYLPLDDGAFWSNGIPLVGPPEELLDSMRLLSREARMSKHT